MKTYSISELGRAFGLSRSTLLYYDRIGLLRASARSETGYRRYSQRDHERLERICTYRRTGLPLAEIQTLLAGDTEPGTALLEKRLKELGEEILALRTQQQLITAMLKKFGSAGTPVINKQMWVEMLAAAGMDEAAMQRWHAEFEQRAPQEHRDFLVSLGISADEVRRIREWSRTLGKTS